MRFLGIGLIALFVQAGVVPSRQAQTAAVQGMILAEGGRGGPISGATVEVRRTDGIAPQIYSASTSADGTFVVSGIRPGQYVLHVRRSGYFTAEYGQRRPSQPGIPFGLAAGQVLQNVQVAMTPAGVIHGRIIDRQGNPVGAAEVRALTFAYQKGVRGLKVVQSAVTDDLGQYRLFDLIPGQYVISATPPSDVPIFSIVSKGPLPVAFETALVTGRRSGGSEESYAPQYFPGVLDSRRASTIELKAGDTYAGADFVVAPMPSRHVRGSMRGSGQHASILLVPVSPVPGVTSHGVSVDPDTGLFDIPGVAPGVYMLVATTEDSMSRQIIEVGDADLNNVGLALTGGFRIPGRLVFDDRAPSDNDPDMDRIYFDIAFDPPIQGAPVDTYSPILNGTFVLRDLIPGDYRVTNFAVRYPTPALQNAYIKSIRLGDQDVLNNGMRVTGPVDSTFEIVVGTKPASLTGRVVNDRGLPVGNATVVLASDTPRRSGSDTYRTATTDASGRFQITRVPPGNFKVFAWENVEDTAWQDPEFIRIYEDRGKALHINEGARETTEVIAIP